MGVVGRLDTSARLGLTDFGRKCYRVKPFRRPYLAAFCDAAALT